MQKSEMQLVIDFHVQQVIFVKKIGTEESKFIQELMLQLQAVSKMNAQLEVAEQVQGL